MKLNRLDLTLMEYLFLGHGIIHEYKPSLPTNPT